MIDEKLTKQIASFLEMENPSDEEIHKAAEIALRINHNAVLYQHIINRPQRHLAKLRYELNKHLRYRLDGLTLADVHKMDKELMPKVESLVNLPVDVTLTDSEGNVIDGIPEKKLGIREDHDELPDDIKALWDDNCERWKKMKELFYTCKEIEASCDRYEHLKILSEMYTKYKEDMEKYDSYNPEDVPAESDAVSDAKKISAARSYISKNRPKYDKLVADNDDGDARIKLFNKIQLRVDTLKENNAEFSEEFTTWLKENKFSM